MLCEVAFACPKANGRFAANANVNVQPNYLTQEEYLTFSRLQLRQISKGRPMIEDRPCPTGGHLLEWSAEMNGMPLKMRQLLVVLPDKAYVVTATAALSDFESHRAEFESILNSFRINDSGL